jgi:hypothetical protein
MNMKRISFAILVLLLAAVACNSSNTTSPQVEQPNVSTVVAATLQAVNANAPTPQSNGIQVSFQNVSFAIPVGLASGTTSELVPAADGTNSDPWSAAPAYISFTLTDYTGRNDSFYKAVVNVYPMVEYAVVNSWAAGSITRLQTVLASPTVPLTNDTLPTIPFNGAAAQEYAAQAKMLSFNGGNGVRMISQYSQFPGPILKDNSLFHYEGLTANGKYLVAVLFPVHLPLQTTEDNVSADGIQFPSDPTYVTDMNSYLQGITDKLNAASPESFQPSLTQLDALVQSITVNSQ